MRLYLHLSNVLASLKLLLTSYCRSLKVTRLETVPRVQKFQYWYVQYYMSYCHRIHVEIQGTYRLTDANRFGRIRKGCFGFDATKEGETDKLSMNTN